MIQAGLTVGSRVRFAGADALVLDRVETTDGDAYVIESGDARIQMRVPVPILERHQDTGRPTAQFRRGAAPAIIVVDGFFEDPDEVRAIALAQEYASDPKFFKGLRSRNRFLWPFLREEFSRLIGRPITEWLGHGANGVFQQTSNDDPLVYHHDRQSFAAAVYLTPDAPPTTGTSFWRDRISGCRRNPDSPSEVARLGSVEAVDAARKSVYDPDQVVSPENWELIESVAGLYNRLVIWDASLIHSATSYVNFTEAGVAPTRLVQLFFFDVG